MENIYNKTFNELNEYFKQLGEKTYRTRQVFDWLYIKRIKDFQEMTNLKKEIIEKLKTDFFIDDIEIIKKESDVLVNKYLLKLKDANTIEAVLMQHDYGNSLCISSEVGCNMACSFCESGRIKKIRNVSSGEMVLQILKIEKDLNIRISHVVIMGIGEPFDNYDNVMQFIYCINEAKGLAIGARHISVSTSGLVPKIRQISNEKLQINLAISLHAPNDLIRNKIMKVNQAYNMQELKDALVEYCNKTNRRLTFEYILLKGINDSSENALELIQYLNGLCCYVNLIPYNAVNESPYQRSDEKNINIFYNLLKKYKINVTIRREFGKDIEAACGQLRAKSEGNKI